MESVISRDGTVIAYERSGSGPPLVLVHGTTADHTRWPLVLPQLERHFTVLAMDRRGRGGSGDAEQYSIELEFDDVAAIVDAAGPGTNLFGHSYGALCSLEAAFRTPNLKKLVLYEPVFKVEGVELYPPGTMARFEALLATDGRDAFLTTFFRELVGASDEEVAALKAAPSWQGRLAAAHTGPRELVDADYVLDTDRVAKLGLPTLLLTGSESPPALRKPTEVLAAALPNARVVELAGQGHVAMNSAPDLFCREVISFLTE